MKILSINPGSSTLKWGLFESGITISRETIENLGEIGLPAAIEKVVKDAGPIDAAGCRVVHGGYRHQEPALVTEEVVESIRAIAPLAPLHNAADLEAIEGLRRAAPSIPIVAVFDTALHRTMPSVASTYALPFELAERHQIQRYGFHGISYKFVLGQLKTAVGEGIAERLIICHLGNGASVCAIRNGVSIDTSMGMTPLEGLVMGTRSGDLDPGVVIFLQQELGASPAEIQDLLNHKSGLAGISGVGPDVREIEKAASLGNSRAELALEIFAYRVAKYIGAYTVALEGLGALAFTGGIGENSADMRARIFKRLGILGIGLDVRLNQVGLQGADLTRIGNDAAEVWVVATDEERQIAIETVGIVSH